MRNKREEDKSNVFENRLNNAITTNFDTQSVNTFLDNDIFLDNNTIFLDTITNQQSNARSPSDINEEMQLTQELQDLMDS